MAIQGVPKFDAVALMRIDAIDFTVGSPQLVAHGAFVASVSGSTFGRTTCRHFSKNTMLKLEELRNAMEEDLAALVFESSQDIQTTAEPALRGLRAELSDTDVESVWPLDLGAAVADSTTPCGATQGS